MNKTNAMRMLDKAKIPYEPKEYIPDENDLSGVHIAEQIGIPPQQCFKTIVTRGDKTGPVVFCIPADLEIDLNLPQLTGYVRGACSPLGMKKKFPTYIHQTCNNFEKITVSAGVKGCQLLVKSNEIVSCIQATVCDLAAEKE